MRLAARGHSTGSCRSRQQTVPPTGMWYVVGGMWGEGRFFPTYHLPSTTWNLLLHPES